MKIRDDSKLGFYFLNSPIFHEERIPFSGCGNIPRGKGFKVILFLYVVSMAGSP